jgi:hypothetical protein
VWVLLAACGGDAPAPAPDHEGDAEAEESGGAPVIESLALRPDPPSAGQEVVLEISASDPDGDIFEVEVDWYVNDAVVLEGAPVRFDTNGLKRGDRIQAKARVSDGEQTVERKSPPIRIGNALPQLNEVRILPAPPLTSQTTYAEVNAVDPDGDEVTLEYEWLVDDIALPDVKGPSLPPGLPKRGQSLRVRACGSDGAGRGEWVESEAVQVGNSEPSITSEPPAAFAGPLRYEYQVQAKDPDGDKPLRYELLEGPSGMEVDLISGFVSWSVPSDANGKFAVKLGVRDGHGGLATQVYDITFDWQDVPAGKQDSAADQPSEE